MKRQLPKRVPLLTGSRAFGQKSPLIEADLQSFLARCFAIDQWQAYTDAERGRISECLPQSERPDQSTFQNDLPRAISTDQTPDPDSTASCDVTLPQSVPIDGVLRPPLDSSDVDTDPYIKRAIARFKRDLGDGYYEKAWQDKARRAHQERMDGKFDEYVRGHAETMFEDDGSLDDGNDCDRDELAQISEDGEYLDKSQRGGRGKGRPRKAR